MQITKVTCPSDKVAIKCPYAMSPTGIVVHNTANDASAMAEISYMLSNANYTSFHYAVDDYRAVQGIEENRNSWNAGDGGTGIGNREKISIEICYSLSGGDLFIASEKNAVELIVDILKRYGWGIDKVTKHQDYSGKYCPHRTLDMGWQRFLNMISAALAPVNPSLPVPNAIALPEPITIIMNLDKVQLWDLSTNPNYKSAKEFNRGDSIDVVGYIPFNNIKYYVTKYTFDNGFKTGFNENDVKIDTSKADAEKARLEAIAKAEQEAVAKKAAEDAEKKAIEDAAAAKKIEDERIAAEKAKELAEQQAAQEAQNQSTTEKTSSTWRIIMMIYDAIINFIKKMRG